MYTYTYLCRYAYTKNMRKRFWPFSDVLNGKSTSEPTQIAQLFDSRSNEVLDGSGVGQIDGFLRFGES